MFSKGDADKGNIIFFLQNFILLKELTFSFSISCPPPYFRLKLEMANGTMSGEDTTCKKTGHNCLEFFHEFHNGNRAYIRRKEYLHKHIAPKYGEYVHMTGTITFDEDELSMSNHYYKFLIRGPGQYFLFCNYLRFIFIICNITKISLNHCNQQKVVLISLLIHLIYFFPEKALIQTLMLCVRNLYSTAMLRAMASIHIL